MDKECIFCKIHDEDIPADFVYRDETVMVIRDIAPQAPIHLLIIPNEHVVLGDSVKNHHERMLGNMFRIAEKIARLQSVDTTGYRLTVNQGRDGGQVVGHLHMHFLSGRSMRAMG